LRFCANASYTASETNLPAHRANWYWLAALTCIRLSKIIHENANGYECLSSIPFILPSLFSQETPLCILLQKEEGENPYEGQFRGVKALIFPFLGTLKPASSTKLAEEPNLRTIYRTSVMANHTTAEL